MRYYAQMRYSIHMAKALGESFLSLRKGTEAVCSDKQSILQSLRSPMVNVWKWWSDGSDTNDLKIETEMSKVKMKMVNVMWVLIKTEMLNGVAKCRGSVTGGSDLIFHLAASLFPSWILLGSFLWLSLRLPSLSLLLLCLLPMSLVYFHFSLLRLCFHFYFHFLSLVSCTGCSFCFHSFFLKNGSPHEEKSSALVLSLTLLLCLMSI